MFLPLSDMPNPRGTPVVNYLLIGINVAVYLLVILPMSLTRPDLNDPALVEFINAIPMYRNVPLSRLLPHISAYDVFIFVHGFKPANPSISDLFFSIFLHAGLLHLAGNMLFLWIYGDNVEHRLGPWIYLPVYLATGVMATLFYSLFQPNSSTPMIGASGAISGVLGLYFLWFPKNKVRVFFMFFPFFMDVVLLPARLVLGFYLIIANLLPFLLNSGSSGGVAYGAHLGGFLAGLGIAYAIDRFPDLANLQPWRLAWRKKGERFSSGETNHDLPLSQNMHEALVREDLSQAASAYFSARSSDARKSLNVSDRLQLGFELLKAGKYTEALTLFRQYIADYPNGPFLDRAYLGAGITLYQGKGQLTSSYQYFLAVLDVDPDPEIRAQAQRYIDSIQALQKMQFRHK